jgi:SecD/SecF fusion protein
MGGAELKPMTARSRILLLSLLVATVAGCGDSPKPRDHPAPRATNSVASPSSASSPQRGPGLIETYRVSDYRGQPAPSVALDRTVSIMQRRLEALGAVGSSVRRRGSNELEVFCARCTAPNAGALHYAAETAQLEFYDWEPNVLGADCRPHPNNVNVTGGQGAGQVGAGSLTYYEAVLRASHCPQRLYAQMAHGLTDYYAIDGVHRRVLSGPESSAKAARLAANRPQPSTAVLAVRPGAVVVHAEYDKNLPADPNKDQWFVLRDDVAVSGIDITNPQQNFDNGPGGTGEPIVTFNFTPRGRVFWRATTRAIAQRGQSAALPGQQASAFFQHFAMVLDGNLISVPFIDYQQNPDGIDAANGSQIQGGFTIRSAQNLANLLKSGSLPVRLRLVSVRRVGPR